MTPSQDIRCKHSAIETFITHFGQPVGIVPQSKSVAPINAARLCGIRTLQRHMYQV